MSWSHSFDLSNLMEMSQVLPESARTLVVSSEDQNESFWDAWNRSWHNTFGRTWSDFLGYDPRESEEPDFTWWVPVGNGEALLVRTERAMTIRQMAAFVDDVNPLRLGWGLGGGAAFPPLMEGLLAVVNAGLTLRGLIALAREGNEHLDRIIYKHERLLFEDWRDGHGLTMKLEQSIRAEAEWFPEKFNRVFGSNPSEMRDLLRTLGYAPSRTEWGARVWRDRAE